MFKGIAASLIFFAVLAGMIATSASAQGGLGPVLQAQRAQQSAAQRSQAQVQPLEVAPQTAPAEQTVTVIEEENPVFGQQIFTGAFAQQSFVGFNPDYSISTGDRILLNMWGSVETAIELVVDAQGNVFIPQIGPVAVRGVLNKDLNEHVTKAVATTFTKNVGVYASLAAAEPVKVFVTGFVKKPGLYAGHASDSVLYFLDSAGGVDKAKGSYIDIEVLRNGETLKQINLYDFLMEGRLPLFQIADGDTVIVKPSKSRVGVFGEVQNSYLFEFDGPNVKIDDLLSLARPAAQATHVRINNNSSEKLEVIYLPIAEALSRTVNAGDVLELTSDKGQGTISVRVEGENTNGKEFVLNYGSDLGDLLGRLDMGADAQKEAIQLFRETVKLRQKEMLMSQLRALEQSVLTAQSNTIEEAQLRTQEAQLVLQWVERAKAVEPLGQVNLGASSTREEILLEAGDIVRIPRTSKLIMVHGEVLFPSAMTYEGGMTVEDYIVKSGGFTQGAGKANVLLLHRDGTFEKITSGRLDSTRIAVLPGDEIFVLPKVATKNFQLAKDIIQILFSLALSAGVVVRL